MTLDDDLVLPIQIVILGNPLLRKPCSPVEPMAWSRPRLERLCRILLATMPAARGVGLAANQIGVAARVIALGDRARLMPGVDPELYERQGRVPFDPYVVVNPVLRPRPETGWSAWFEGCLSFPGHTGLVSRWNEVDIEGTASDGSPIRATARGWQARILQHEVDHLDGVLYIDRAPTRTLMHKREFATNWGQQPIDSVLRSLGVSVTAPADLEARAGR